jgi:PAS domain S-box-containing protein
MRPMATLARPTLCFAQWTGGGRLVPQEMTGCVTAGSCPGAAGDGATSWERYLSELLSAELVRHILDSAPDAMVIIDPTGTIVFANRQVTVLFGYESREVKGKPVELLLPERFRSRHVQHRTGYATNLRVRPMGNGLELFALRKDGTEFPVEISLSPISDQGEKLIAAAIRDVTERRRIERELSLARESAERTHEAKSRFLATASHDLRQPVQALALLNGALRRMARDPDLTEALAQQEVAIDSMGRLLNALLDISKLESGAVRPAPCDCNVMELFSQVRNEFAGLANNKGLQFEIQPCAAEIHTDPVLIGQVLRNLVSNAIKYTLHGKVALRCRAGDGQFLLEVSDTGIGIPPEQLAHVFEEFYQVGVKTNATRDGYGLGLSIVQRIVQLLGHKLEVTSQPDRGTTVIIRVPAGSQGVAGSQEPGDARHAGATMRVLPHVLLVEDDPGVRNATRMLLKVEGFRVTTATGVAEALQAARAHPDITLLVTDFHLPDGETGTMVIEALRERLSPELPVVLITGDTSTAVRELRHDELLRLASKPINADELMRLVRELRPLAP